MMTFWLLEKFPLEEKILNEAIKRANTELIGSSPYQFIYFCQPWPECCTSESAIISCATVELVVTT